MRCDNFLRAMGISINIKNLLFDLGGVIMDIERQRCVEALEKLGMYDAGLFLGDYVQSGPFLQLENGDISAAQFRNEIRARVAAPLTDLQIDDAMNKFLIGIPVRRLAQLRHLRSRYKIYMLSNTNPIMFSTKIPECFQIEGYEMNYYFDGIITSFESHASKPDLQIFRRAISTLNIIPEETLFFDDSEKNIEAARGLGFNTHLVRPGEEFYDFFLNQDSAK